jgi:tRNA (pseudouridine54-N1)-methyltransferase
MIRFVVAGHRAYTTADFKLDDIAGGAGRLDVLVRCVNSSFFLSHALRQDAELYLVLMGGTDAPKTIRFSGKELRYLNPDERSTSSLIRNALIKKIGEGETKASPGIYISRMSFKDVVDRLAGISAIAYLKEDGKDIRTSDIPDDVTFVLGDDRDLTDEEESVVLPHCPERICLGPKSLHADHCIILVLNETDRRS